ncbi:hypothetical protein HDG40_000016 [Paraburkholderia sp. JPY158]|uniref:Uncharacterized protein n=1 Tax=Paraburkholderia atlantica TaxID=2654982 RepID=A0A7W8Q245_PARAM|nr:hypothetical protein [Paraburkholderia atlantica]MBB5421875.1 hypothetical protein [Paraburkholderia atlantica]
MKSILPVFSSEKKQSTNDLTTSRQATLLSRVEPFVDLNIAKARINAIDQSVVARFQSDLNEQLASESLNQLAASLASVLAEIKADIHYLTAALVEERRYSDPDFNFKTPDHGLDKPKLSAFEIDLRGQVTGGNWYYPEADGRWAGPESESSLLFPALDQGAYRVEVDVVDEIESGVIDDMAMFVNGFPVTFRRSVQTLPTKLQADFTVGPDYKLPFWAVKFKFSKLRSPASLSGSDDRRTLAIRAASLRFVKVGA